MLSFEGVGRIWRKLSTMEKNRFRPHRTLGLGYLALCLALQPRLMMNYAMGSYRMGELLEEGNFFVRFMVQIYGIWGVVLPASGLVVFLHHLRDRQFDKVKGNSLDSVVVNLYFQVGHAFMYYRTLPGFWPEALQSPILDWLVAEGIWATFDFIVAPKLTRQSLRKDGLFIYPWKNQILAVMMLIDKQVRMVAFATIILGANKPLLGPYDWVQSTATNHLFTYPIYMFFYTLRMKNIMSSQTFERFVTVYTFGFSIILSAQPVISPMQCSVAQNVAKMGLVAILAVVNLHFGRAVQHITYNAILLALFFHASTSQAIVDPEWLGSGELFSYKWCLIVLTSMCSFGIVMAVAFFKSQASSDKHKEKVMHKHM